jgi:formylmethanofuran dehydrogenase subunit A
MFGQTVTASGDTMRQYANHTLAHPKKWMCMDIECEAGCGVVPFRYRDRNFVNALQWAIGLETFLQVDDPWRVFLTTDHPNGAPFTSYPHLIRLLMDRGFRNQAFASIDAGAQKASHLASLDREYSLYEIAIMTRAAPARTLGLADRGHLGDGAAADITVYDDHADRERMFATPRYVFKDGRLVVEQGQIVDVVWGTTHVVRPEFDRSIERSLAQFFDRYRTVQLDNFVIRDEEIANGGHGALSVQACAKSGRP